MTNRAHFLQLWAITILGFLLLPGCGSDGERQLTGAGPSDTEVSGVSFSAQSGPMEVTLLWSGADPINILYAHTQDCDWNNYSLCEGGGMVASTFGGQHVLTVEDDKLEANRTYYFVGETEGALTRVLSARPWAFNADGPTDSLVTNVAATMQPGEWRNIADLTTWPGKEGGRSFKSFQSVGPMSAPPNTYSVDGIGWTQRLVYHNGSLLILAMRDGAPTALLGMNPDGTWWRKDTMKVVDGEAVPGEMTGWMGGGWAGTSGGRRPFNRLTQDDEYLYFSRTVGTGSKEEHGRTYRTPLDNPGAFEDSGHHGFGQSNIDTVGNHAILWVAEWNRFYAFTPGGWIWSRSPEDASWHRHGRTPHDGTCRATGYAGEIAYNATRDELIIIGGQTFGSSPNCGMKWVRMMEPFGEIEELPDLPMIDGHQLRYTSAVGKLFVHPHAGSYLLQVGMEKIYHADNVFSEWTLYEDLYNVQLGDNQPFGRWEAYAPLALIPGTDVYVFVSHIRGLVLHRVHE